MRQFTASILFLALAACSGPAKSDATPEAASPATHASTATAGATAGTPASVNPPTAAAAPAGDTITVKNPLGKEMQAAKHENPASGSIEHTLLSALQHQAKSGDFKGFLGYIHPNAKQEPTQVDRLKAYNYTSSKGRKAAACVHDGALITTGRKEINVAIQGGGDVGTKVMVFCGAGRMPVPFTLYPDGDTAKITVWGLN